MSPVLLAIHLPDNVIANPWCVGGFVGYGADAVLGRVAHSRRGNPTCRRIDGGILRRVANPCPLARIDGAPSAERSRGRGSGPCAGLAIPIGLFLQMALFQHGGWTTLGVNSCVMGVPALLAWLLFIGLRRLPWIRRAWFRGTLVAASVILFSLSAAYALALLATNPLDQEALNTEWANRVTFHPGTRRRRAGSRPVCRVGGVEVGKLTGIPAWSCGRRDGCAGNGPA